MKVLVYGYYNKKNLGDDLFTYSFRSIFPDFSFTFTDLLTSENILESDAIFFGGGSFLDQKPRIDLNAEQLLCTKPIFYMGVGADTCIHPFHQELLKISKLIALRYNANIDIITELNSNVMIIPDLVYVLQNKAIHSNKQNKSVLILPNAYLVPQHKDPHYKHTSWSYFCSEFAQFIDNLIENNYQVKFFPMSQNNTLHDHNASIEIINQLTNRDNDLLITDPPQSIEEVSFLFSQFQLIITQRFHGIILADIAKTNHISIYHHSKIKEDDSLYYYGINKNILLEKFEDKINKKYQEKPINLHSFEELNLRTTEILNDEILGN
jgi:polysaccharide pyruvyl transferase WcaK-like protein